MFKKRYRTDFLFPSNGFLMGMGNVFNIGGNYFRFNTSSSEKSADAKAIKNDWAMIGQDFRKIFDENPGPRK